MIAGPNGSGKTTVKNGLQRPDSWFGIYINPDDLEKSATQTGLISVEPFGLQFSVEDLRGYFAQSPFLNARQLNGSATMIGFRNGILDFRQAGMNSYFASVLADFLRRQALLARKSFSFETVMSSTDKVDPNWDQDVRNSREDEYGTDV
jgi:hypothetical protein